jgi:hypothetical protein
MTSVTLFTETTVPAPGTLITEVNDAVGMPVHVALGLSGIAPPGPGPNTVACAAAVTPSITAGTITFMVCFLSSLEDFLLSGIEM